MADSLWIRLRKVPWDQFDCAPGTGKKASKMLENLSSRKLPRAMKASHELWSALCSGGIQSMAEPCAPFLVEILDISQPGVQNEILDILLKLTALPTSEPERHARICQSILRTPQGIQKLSRSNDVQLNEKAQLLLEQLG